MVLIISFHTKAQVTIGEDEEPVTGALLQLKEKLGVTDGTSNSYRGLVLPRVTLSDKTQLYPMFLADPEDPNSGPNNDYAGNKASIDQIHTGMIVYNLVEDEDKDLCKGLNYWDGGQWACFQAKTETAKISAVSCSDITINGVYIVGNVVTEENYLTIKLDVLKVGAFNISASTGNGYSFHISGVASNIGTMTVNIPSQGTPNNVQTDELILSGVELTSGCVAEINVVDPVANHSLNCLSATVNGLYQKGAELTSENTITLNVTATEAGSYSISTPVTSGVSFSASGNLVAGVQSVTLTGSGIPTVNDDFIITINSNATQGSTTCSVTIPVVLPAMTYAVITGSGVWSWSTPERTRALDNAGNFGPTGKVKMADVLTSLWQAPASSAADSLNKDIKPDIVLYYAYGTTMGNNLTTALADYINAGGCLIYGIPESITQVNSLLNAVFGISPAQYQIIGEMAADNNYQIANLPNDPLINGPFGNLCSKYWAEDNDSQYSVILNSLPSNSVQICSAYNPVGKKNVDPAYSIVWYNDAKNFVYFGDDAGATSTDNSIGSYPVYYTATGLSQPKLYGPSASQTQYVYNSALELNAVAWALKKAANYGINPH
jgi:hypothetical protein